MRVIYTISFILMLAAGCSDKVTLKLKNNAAVVFKFSNYIGNRILVLDNEYTNSLHEPLTVYTFKYYITNIALQDSATGKWLPIPNSFFLIDESDSTSKEINVNANTGNYKAVSFLTGVDSLYNVSGVQTGALDPAKGMFWTWNTGYIQAKFEGYSPVAKTVNEKFTYHIGGFKHSDNTVRRVVLPLSEGIHLTTKNKAAVVIKADADKWFNSVHRLSIADSAHTMTPGKLAMQFADNYATMFTVTGVINE